MDILGIGECMIELDADASLSQSSRFSRQIGGDVYNTLAACQKLGNASGFYTRVAMDGFGEYLLQQFLSHGIDTRHVQRSTEGVNGLYLTALDENGQHQFLYYRTGSAASHMSTDLLSADVMKTMKIVYASGITQAISPSARQTVLKAFQMAKKYGVTVAYDPNMRPLLWKHRNLALEALIEVMPYIDVIFPSMEDMRYLFDFHEPSQVFDYFRLREIPVIALKRGAEGSLIGFKQNIQHIPALPAPLVVDTIGAGDAYNAGFLHGLLQQKSLYDCARMGSAVAALSLRARGPIQGLPTLSEVEPLLSPPLSQAIPYEASV